MSEFGGRYWQISKLHTQIALYSLSSRLIGLLATLGSKTIPLCVSGALNEYNSYIYRFVSSANCLFQL